MQELGRGYRDVHHDLREYAASVVAAPGCRTSCRRRADARRVYLLEPNQGLYYFTAMEEFEAALADYLLGEFSTPSEWSLNLIVERKEMTA
jgi:hypothetical protein